MTVGKLDHLYEQLKRTALTTTPTGKLPLVPCLSLQDSSNFLRPGLPTFNRPSIGKNVTFQELLPDFALFTHALFFTHGDLRVDPVMDFVQLAGRPDAVFWTRSEDQLFRGLRHWREAGPRNSWNNVLCGCHRSIWPDLYNFLCQVQAATRDWSHYWRTIPQLLPVPDYRAIRKKPAAKKMPTFDVMAFAYDSTSRLVSFAEPSGKAEPVKLKYARPDPETIKTAEQVKTAGIQVIVEPREADVKPCSTQSLLSPVTPPG